MRLHSGRFFVLAVPNHEGSTVELKYSNMNRIINNVDELISTEGSELDENLGRILASNDPHRNHTIHSTIPILIPLFIYDVVGSKDQSNRYPELIKYRRGHHTLYLEPDELHFSKDARLIVHCENKKHSFDLKRKSNKIELNEGLLNPPYRITVQQEEFEYLLERSKERIEYTKSRLQSLIYFPFLSLKDILDPKLGLERLIADIQANRFQLGLQRKKIENLLDIIRVAQDHEELEIMRSLLLNDFPFYELVIDKLYSENLLPYMNRQEVSELLAKFSDDDLSSIASLEAPRQKLYRRFFSKNRFAAITNNTVKSKLNLWKLIFNHYKDQYRRLISFVSTTHNCFIKEETKVAEEFNATFSSCSHTNLDATLRLVKYHDRALLIAIDEYCSKLEIYIETRLGEFLRYNFRAVKPALLMISEIDQSPRRVIMAGIGHDNTLYESIAIKNRSI